MLKEEKQHDAAEGIKRKWNADVSKVAEEGWLQGARLIEQSEGRMLLGIMQGDMKWQRKILGNKPSIPNK